MRVLGAVFNRFPSAGFYSIEKCHEFLQLYFSRSKYLLFGLLAETDSLAAASADLNSSCRIRRGPIDATDASVALAQVKLALPQSFDSASSDSISLQTSTSASTSSASAQLADSNAEIVSSELSSEAEIDRIENARITSFIQYFSAQVQTFSILASRVILFLLIS